MLQDRSGNVFKYAHDLSEITLPIILTEIIKKNLISEGSMLKFQEFIFSKYRYFNKGHEIIPLVKPSLEKKVYIPLSKIAKYFIRLYTSDTDFYKHLNTYLSNINGFGPYKIFILILYFSIQNKSLKSCVDKKLYRGSMLSIQELNEIISIVDKKNNRLENEEESSLIKINLDSENISIRENNEVENKISSALYYSKHFMSFSKSRQRALDFLKEINESNKNQLRRVLFILNPPKEKDKIFFSNIDIDEYKISAYKEEKEVLFLPFSCFEIEGYKKIGEFDYEITLNYLDKYYDQLNTKISGMKDDDEIQSFYERVLESPFSKNVIDCLDDYKNIYDNINDFFSGHSSISNPNLNINKIIPKLPHDKLIPHFNENEFQNVPLGFSNGKQLNELYSKEPISIQLLEHKTMGYKALEMKYVDSNKALIRQHRKKGINVIIKKFDEIGRYGYYNDVFNPASNEIKIGETNTNEVLFHSKEFNMAEIEELSLLRSGFSSANLIVNAIGYNLANADNFIKLSKTDQIKIIGENLGLTFGMSILANFAKSAVPAISTLLLGGFYIYDLASDIRNPILTKKETAISILKNTSNLSVNIGTGIGGFYAGLKIGVSFGIVTGPGSIIVGLGTGLLGGLIGGLFGRFFCSTKMVLNCNSFYKNYIPLKYREEGNIPDLFWENVNKNTKSFALEAIIDHNEKRKTWSVINIPPQLRKISPNIGETLIKYGNFFQYNPSTVDYFLYSIKEEKITKEDWNDQNKRKQLIIDVAILEVNQL